MPRQQGRRRADTDSQSDKRYTDDSTSFLSLTSDFSYLDIDRTRHSNRTRQPSVSPPPPVRRPDHGDRTHRSRADTTRYHTDHSRRYDEDHRDQRRPRTHRETRRRPSYSPERDRRNRPSPEHRPRREHSYGRRRDYTPDREERYTTERRRHRDAYSHERQRHESPVHTYRGDEDRRLSQRHLDYDPTPSSPSRQSLMEVTRADVISPTSTSSQRLQIDLPGRIDGVSGERPIARAQTILSHASDRSQLDSMVGSFISDVSHPSTVQQQLPVPQKKSAKKPSQSKKTPISPKKSAEKKSQTSKKPPVSPHKSAKKAQTSKGPPVSPHKSANTGTVSKVPPVPPRRSPRKLDTSKRRQTFLEPELPARFTTENTTTQTTVAETTRTTRSSKKQAQPRRISPEKRARSKPNSKVLKDIRKYQKSTKLLIPRLPFSRVVREVMLELKPDFRITIDALMALQESAEMYITNIMTDCMMVVNNRNQVTIQVKDMRLVIYLRDPGRG